MPCLALEAKGPCAQSFTPIPSSQSTAGRSTQAKIRTLFSHGHGACECDRDGRECEKTRGGNRERDLHHIMRVQPSDRLGQSILPRAPSCDMQLTGRGKGLSSKLKQGK